MPTQLLFPRKVNEDDNDIDVDIDVDIEHATSARPLACLEHNQVNYPALSLSAAIKEIPMADRYVGRENSQDEILVRSDSTDALDKLTAPRACPPPLKRGQDGEYLDAPFRRMSREFTHHSHTFASDLARRSFDVARTSLDVAGTLLRTGTVMAAPSFGSSRAAPVPQEEMIESGKATAADKHQEPDDGDDPLAFTRTFAGGICADIKRRAPWYVSDWTDAFKAENRSQSLASIIFLFFACFAPAVTFGMLFDEYTEGQLGIIETILSRYIFMQIHCMYVSTCEMFLVPLICKSLFSSIKTQTYALLVLQWLIRRAVRYLFWPASHNPWCHWTRAGLYCCVLQSV